MGGSHCHGFYQKKVVIKIQNEDERRLGYALLNFLERERLPEKWCHRVAVYKEKMFQRHHIETLPYPISLTNVHLYEDQVQMNINIFFF